MLERLNIMLVGVGGQGALLAGKVLSQVALELDLDVRVAEVHGMAQRGGSVVTTVKMGQKLFSPLVEPGQADCILAFEELEALRWATYLAPDGVMLVNSERILPTSVNAGQALYPQDITARLTEAKRGRTKVLSLDALSLAREAGTERAVNIVLIGALSQLVDIPEEIFIQAIRRVVAERWQETNIRAFSLGSGIIKTTAID